MANVNNPDVIPPYLKKPRGFSEYPSVNKLKQLYDANNAELYNKLSPYTENSGVLSFGPRQPYVYIFPNGGRKGVNGLKRFDSRLFPIGSGIQDVQRTAKFLVSGKGIAFLTKQFLLQRANSFTEVRIYNPTSTLTAAARPVTLFSTPNPKRHLEGGLVGILGGLVGLNLSKPSRVAGTIGTLPTEGPSNFKGLVRAPTANAALTKFKTSHGGGSGAGGLVGRLLSNIGGPIGAAVGLFNSFKPQSQSSGDDKYPLKERSDEIGYNLLLNSPKLAGNQINQPPKKSGFGGFLKSLLPPLPTSFSNDQKIRQRWYNSKNTNGKPNLERRLKLPTGGFLSKDVDTLNGVSIGYTQEESEKYTDAVYLSTSVTTINRSDIVLLYKNIISEDKEHKKIPRNISDDQGGRISIDNVSSIIKNAQFVDGTYSKKILRDIQSASGSNATPVTEKRKTLERDVYTVALKNKLEDLLKKDVNITTYKVNKFYESDVDLNYKSLMSHKNVSESPSGYVKRLRENKILMLEDPQGKGFSGTGKYDQLNTFEVADLPTNSSGDIISFYFHDLVNDKYIPFRSTIKGINEQLTANWSEVSYIGRADKLYNYVGFSRTLGFNFSIAAMSLQELRPMWSRINYLAGLIKPSRYVEGNTPFDNFVVPPLTTITIGDMYKDQPYVLQSVGISIPEDALWETVPESETEDWSYFNKKIIAKGGKDGEGGGKGKFAQFPREIEISVSGQLLEVERPRTGGVNFGDGEGNFSKGLIVT